jgi:AraC family transcriptional regulator
LRDDIELQAILGCRDEVVGDASASKEVMSMGEFEAPSNPLSSSELTISAEMSLSIAELQLMLLNHHGPTEHEFIREGVFWMDLCLTPRRPTAKARYVDHWGPHRFSEMGSLIALPPRELLHLKNAGGKHASLVCQLNEGAVRRWLPEDFDWTDRRLEACLHIASDRLRTLLLWLNGEMRRPDSSEVLCEAIITQVSIELARYIASVNEPTEKGGLASWRLRVIDMRLNQPGNLATLPELAALCKMSVRQLTRGFRTSMGCSISAHLAQRKIDEAKRRLAEGQSIADVTAALGYASKSAFTYAFRQGTGTTPGQYRKSFGSEYRVKQRRGGAD